MQWENWHSPMGELCAHLAQEWARACVLEGRASWVITYLPGQQRWLRAAWCPRRERMWLDSVCMARQGPPDTPHPPQGQLEPTAFPRPPSPPSGSGPLCLPLLPQPDPDPHLGRWGWGNPEQVTQSLRATTSLSIKWGHHSCGGHLLQAASSVAGAGGTVTLSMPQAPRCSL